MLRIYIELVFLITTIAWNFISNIFNLSNTGWPEMKYINLISFGVAVTLALQTTYIVEGRRGKVWNDTFGFDPDKFKD
jgi:hypothetical protein